MDGGFEIYGADGVLQVSDKFFNFSLKAKGLLSVTDNSLFFSLDLPLTAAVPLLAFRSDTVFIAVHSVVKSGDSYSYRLNTSGTGTFQWLLFDKIGSAISPSGTRCGRQVWGPDGTLAFDSGIPVLKIAGVVPPRVGVAGGGYKVADLSEGTYGFVLTDSGIFGSPTSTGGILSIDAARCTSTALYRQRIQLKTTTGNTPRGVTPETIIIDLKNIPWG